MNAYLDMDGVLLNFIKSAVQAHGVNYDSAIRVWPRGEWDAYKVLNLPSDAAFWYPISKDPYFWDDLEQYHWARSVIREIQRIDPDFQFASKPSSCKNCFHGKSEWVRKFGFDPAEKLNVMPDKVRLCQPGDLLIDDNDKNCEGWLAKGGRVVLFPQPWNRNGHINDPLRFLQSELRKMRFDD